MPKKIKQIHEKRDKQWDRLESIIARNYSASNMSNSKWVKLFKIVASISNEIPCMNYKLVYGEEVFYSFTEQHEEHVEEQWFIEPLIYKEIEWVEFPVKNNIEATKIQNISLLKEKLILSGKFPIEETETGVRVHAYHKA